MPAVSWYIDRDTERMEAPVMERISKENYYLNIAETVLFEGDGN